MPRTRLLGMILLLAMSGLSCQSLLLPVAGTDGQIVPFQTIGTEEWESGYDSREPQLFLVTTAKETATLEPFITAEHLEKVRQTDFAQDVVIVLFRGVQSASNYKGVIERLTLLESTVTVHAQFWEPAPNQPSAAVVTSPYHLVKVARTRLPATDIQLALESRIVQP